MNQLRENLIKKIPCMIIVFCILQPLLDVAGWWQMKLGMSNTITTLARIAILGLSVLVGFIISDKKRNYWILGGILVLLTAGHVYACIQKGNTQFTEDLTNLVRIYLLPFTTLALIDCMKTGDKAFSAMVKGMVINLGIIVLVEILSELTGTDPHTYEEYAIGILGWFNWTNSQSAILSMLAPVSICYAYRKWKDKFWPVVLVATVSMAALYFLAPRLAYASLVACGIGMPFTILVTEKKEWKKAVAILLVCVIFVCLYPVSPMKARQEVNAGINQNNEDNMSEVKVDSLDDLEKVYNTYVYSLVQRFGIEKVAEYYNYTLDPLILDNRREMKLNYCDMEMQNSGVWSHLFGLGLEDLYVHIDVFSTKYGHRVVYDECLDPENDFHGIYYLTGAVGLGLLLIGLLYIAYLVLSKLIKEPKKYFTLEMGAFGIAFCCAMVHAYCTASILRRNNGSVYLAFVIAGLWYLACQKKYENE